MNDYARRCDAYGLKIDTAPTSEPITTDDAKLHLRVDNTDEDDYIDGLVTAARVHVETFLQKRLLTQTWLMTRDVFPVGSLPISLPYGPVKQIESVKYIDTAGVLQTMSTSLYELDDVSLIARLYPTYGNVWPDTRDIQNAVRVLYTTGYADPDDIPKPIIQAMYMLIGHWYENREAVSAENLQEVPMAVQSLLSGERIVTA